MRSMDINKQYVYYKNVTGKTEDVDEYGNATGQYSPIYGNLVNQLLNVSAARGTYEVQQFGENANYNRTITTNDMLCGIKEDSVLWVGLCLIKIYDSTHSYVVNDLCIYSGTIYKCKTNTTGAWALANWETVPYNHIVTGVAKSINSITYAIKEVKVK